MNNIVKTILISTIIATSVSSCSREKESFDIDITKLNLPKPKIEPKEKDLKIESEKELTSYKLQSLKRKDEIINNINYGRDDPFSKTDGDTKQLIANFHLKGFISIKGDNFALVNYQNESGVININSVGGLNTKLIPNEGFVKEINPQNEEIILVVNEENFNIKLGEK